jgi:hypothetical protein
VTIWCKEGKYHQQTSKNVTNPSGIQVFWNVRLYCSQNLKNFRKMASIWLVLNTRNHTPIIRHHIPDDFNPQQHHCKTCKYCNACYKSLLFALNMFTNTRARKTVALVLLKCQNTDSIPKYTSKEHKTHMYLINSQDKSIMWQKHFLCTNIKQKGKKKVDEYRWCIKPRSKEI